MSIAVRRCERTTKDTPVVKIDREKFSKYCMSNGHSFSSISAAFSSSNYISQRFKRYDGTFPVAFIDWCNRVYPASAEKLDECVVRDPVPEKHEESKPEQIVMSLPSVTKDRIITIQPVSLMGINQIVDALNRISEQLSRLEAAWNGNCKDGMN